MVQKLPMRPSAQAVRHFLTLFQEGMGYSAKPAHEDHRTSTETFRTDASLENSAVRCLETSLRAAQHKCARLQNELLQAQLALDRMHSDLDRTKAGERRAHHLATHDNLTSLPNRLLFLDRLAQSIDGGTRKSLPMALLYLDLDGFKDINDAHGHTVGDEVLKVVSSRLRAALRHGDLVSRLGGMNLRACWIPRLRCSRYASWRTSCTRKSRILSVATAWNCKCRPAWASWWRMPGLHQRSK